MTPETCLDHSLLEQLKVERFYLHTRMMNSVSMRSELWFVPRIQRPKLQFCAGRLVKEANDLLVPERRAGKMFCRYLKNIRISEPFSNIS